MADSSVAITAGSGTPIRVLTGLGTASADQQVVTLADSAGNLLGTTAAPVPVSIAGAGGLSTVSGSITATVANTPGTAVTTSGTGQVVAPVSTAGNVTFHVVTSAFVGTLNFEGSVDAGLNYGSIMAIREDGTGAESSTAINTGSAFIRVYTAALPGIQYFRVRASAFTSGSVAVLLAPGPTLIEPNPSLAAGTQAIGSVTLGAASNLIGAVNIGASTPSASSIVTTASTNASNIKASAGFVHSVSISNPTATAAYVKLYNKASSPTVGTDVPVVTLRVAATGSAGDTVVFAPSASGARFTTGISIAVTAAAVATDTAAAVAGVQILVTYA